MEAASYVVFFVPATNFILLDERDGSYMDAITAAWTHADSVKTNLHTIMIAILT